MKTEEILKRNLPEYQQGNADLDAYLEAAGEFLDGAKQAIEWFDYSRHPEKSTQYQLEKASYDRGMKLSPRVNESIRRRVLRDAAEIFRKNGTTDALVHALRTIGVTPNIENAWLYDPREIRRGYRRDPNTGFTERYDISRIVYTDLLYGVEVIKPEGIFFEGYEYVDYLKENKLGPFPIVGERYEETPEFIHPVEKTPYVIIRFDGSDWLSPNKAPTVDDEDEDVANFTPSERFELVMDVLRFFMFKTMRPTPMRVILIVDTIYIEDEMQIEDEYEDRFYAAQDSDEELEIEDEFIKSSYVEFDCIKIGPNNLIGTETPLLSHVSPIPPLFIGCEYNTSYHEELTSWPAFQTSTMIRENIVPYFIPTRGYTTAIIFAPSDSEAQVWVYVNKGDTVGTLIDTVPAGTDKMVDIPLGYDMFRVTNAQNKFTRNVTVQVLYKEYPRVGH